MAGHSIASLARLFVGERAFCDLLSLLLTVDTPLGSTFRRNFSTKCLQPALGLELGDKPVDVRSEYNLTAAGEVSQTIDLLLELPNQMVGIEVKVHPGAARKGQLAAQYRALRQKAPPGTRVSLLFIYPGPTNRHAEVKPLVDGDCSASMDWKDILGCLSTLPDPADPDLVIATLVQAAKQGLTNMSGRAPKTKVTAARDAVRAELEEAARLFDEALGRQPSDSGCSHWHPHFWRGPRTDQLYGPLAGPDGIPRKGQYLSLSARYSETKSTGIPVRVAFILELKGGVKMYRAEFEAVLPRLVGSLPAPIGTRGRDRDGAEFFDEFSVRVRGEDVELCATGAPLRSAAADLLNAYATTFGCFLYRHARTGDQKRRKSAG